MLHEASIAYSIVRSIEEVVKARGFRDAKVKEVNIEIGALALVDVESLRFALEVVSKGTLLEGAKFNFHYVTPRLRCRCCGYEWSVKPTDLSDEEKLLLHFMPDRVYEMLRCPRCGCRDVDVVEGLDVKIKSVKVETSEGG